MIHITGTMTDLARSETGMNGIHIHELGDMSNGCESVGPHFNPTGQDHGGQTDAARHVGDLGNIAIDSSGSATLDLWDSQLQVDGPNSILGRSIVVSYSMKKIHQENLLNKLEKLSKNFFLYRFTQMKMI